jgi:hypothetical protein
MPDFKLRTGNWNTYRKVKEVFEQTRILKRQLELELGRWSFVVFGPQGNESTIIREGCAVHLRVDNALVYIATVGNPDDIGVRGMPIEEFAQGDIPPELEGLEIYHIDPLRPLKVFEKRKGPPFPEAAEVILEEYRDKNIAVIETPDESYWSLSVLKYLKECDQFFPDSLTEALKKGKLPLKGYFSSDITRIH